MKVNRGLHPAEIPECLPKDWEKKPQLLGMNVRADIFLKIQQEECLTKQQKKRLDGNMLRFPTIMA
jgi:hypothetical protein